MPRVINREDYVTQLEIRQRVGIAPRGVTALDSEGVLDAYKLPGRKLYRRDRLEPVLRMCEALLSRDPKLRPSTLLRLGAAGCLKAL